jgi:hypothetical protein
VCDHVVALDGRYALFDDVRVASPQEQADAIAHAAYGAGVGLTLVQPRHPFRDEMQKRTALFGLGELAATAHEDWFLILDADEVLCPTVTAGMVRMIAADADAAGCPVVCGTLRETIDEQCNEQRSRAARKHATDNTVLAPNPRMWKVHDAMMVQGYHYHYSGLDAAGERIVLWNRDGDGPRASWHHVDELVIETRCLLRSAARAQKRVEYYAERDRMKAENVEMGPVMEAAR